MIKIQNICKSFGTQKVLVDINLSIKEREKILITGQNGAGKTTLMRLILAELIANSGELEICGINPLKDRKNALKNLSFVPQTPPPLRLKINELVEYAIKTSNSSLERIKLYLNALEFDFQKESEKAFYKLSGGMKQKLLIAIALARASKIIMFDEPTANLDPRAREIFLNLLRENFKEQSMIFISHRLSEVKGIVKRIVEIDLGRIVKDKVVE